MPAYIALLRAVNLGGYGKLPMAELKAMCVAAGFSKVQTYIASGNVVFETKMSAKKIKAVLEARLQSYAGKPVGVLVRTLDEIAAVLESNPFPDSAPNRTVAIFLDQPPAASALDDVRGMKDEELRLGTREIYVRYGALMGQSKLKIPAAKTGTARNMNTVAKLVELAHKLRKKQHAAPQD
jgi:uncharacterized protein (DUF1697 family)